nr:YceD family protein [Acaricomes phytoseiuli]
MIAVQEGSPVDLDLSLEAVHEGIFVSGAARVHGTGECSRCLDPLERDFDIDIQEMFFFEAPEPVRARGGDEEADDEQRLIEDEMIDLDPALRDAVVTALPFQPVCRDDCPGLCSECGVHLADHPGHHHEAVDPRWDALRGFTEDPEQK